MRGDKSAMRTFAKLLWTLVYCRICSFNLTLPRSCTKFKFAGQRSRSQDEIRCCSGPCGLNWVTTFHSFHQIINRWLECSLVTNRWVYECFLLWAHLAISLVFHMLNHFSYQWTWTTDNINRSHYESQLNNKSFKLLNKVSFFKLHFKNSNLTWYLHYQYSVSAFVCYTTANTQAVSMYKLQKCT